MFELPLARNSNRVRTVRKLRYQYINSLSQEHRRIQDSAAAHATLPTPENSAAEDASDGDQDSEDAGSRRRRRKRRILSVLGHIDSESELSDVDMSTESHHSELQESEKEFFSHHEKPQDTYETWNTDRRKAVSMTTATLSYAENKLIEARAQRRVIERIGHFSRIARSHFNTIKRGYEIYSRPSQVHQTTHITHLNELLHINVMEGQWETAFRCFSILIRLPGVDIRSMWGLGVRILRELSSTDKNVASSDEFLGWLSGIYTSRSNFNHTMNFLMDPVFRTGSKKHTAKFVSAWLWEMLFAACPDKLEERQADNGSGNRKLIQLLEKLSEMVLIPPYMEDPEIWFIYALCHLVSADELSQRFTFTYSESTELERDISRNQVTQHITNAHNCIRTCEAKGDDFFFPRRIIEEQLAFFERRLYEHVGDSTTSEQDSPHEMTFEPHNFDTQDLPSPGMSSFVEEENYFGTAERVHFGFDSDSSS